MNPISAAISFKGTNVMPMDFATSVVRPNDVRRVWNSFSAVSLFASWAFAVKELELILSSEN
jgi:LDH2 family malate/lactate/ureidoglycolate dehydrogenase